MCSRTATWVDFVDREAKVGEVFLGGWEVVPAASDMDEDDCKNDIDLEASADMDVGIVTNHT